MILHDLFRMKSVVRSQGRDHSGMLLACGERLVGVIEPEAHVRLYHHMQCRNLVDELGPPAESTDTAMEFLMADHPVAAASLPGALHAEQVMQDHILGTAPMLAEFVTPSPGSAPAGEKA